MRSNKVISDKKFYEKRWFIILMLIFVAPVGIWLVIKKTKLSRFLKIIITIFFAWWTLVDFAFYQNMIFGAPPATSVNSVQAKPVVQTKKVDDKATKPNQATKAVADNKEVHTEPKPVTPVKPVEHPVKPAAVEPKAAPVAATPKPVVTSHPVEPKPQPVVSTQSQQASSSAVNTQNNNSSNNDNSSSYNTGVIKTLGTGRHHARLHTSPSAHSSGYDLEGGTVVTILGETNGYYHVRLQDGSTGYVYEHYVSYN